MRSALCPNIYTWTSEPDTVSEQLRLERGGEQGIREKRSSRPGGGSLLPCLSCWADENSGDWRELERMRDRERRRAERKVKFLGFWVVLFVLICDCFVVNLLDRICSLFGWFLVCLEDNNVIFGQWFCLEPMYNRIYQNFCFLVKMMC